jgi:hypothetical protein
MLFTLVLNFIACLLFVPPSSAQGNPAQCPSNITYTVVHGDDCRRIARAHSIPTALLISVNNADCANLWSM